MKKKILRERERDNIFFFFFVQEKYAQNGREWQIYSKRMRKRRAKIKADKREK